MTTGIAVLVVEDEPVTADAHRAHAERVPGPTVAGVAHTGRAALRLLGTTRVDLVLLDLTLPDPPGLEVCRRARDAGLRGDVVAVTPARDLGAVRAATPAGVVPYVLEPFTSRVLADGLERHRHHREARGEGGPASGQRQVDQVLVSSRGVDTGALPAGLSEETLGVVAALQGPASGLSAARYGAVGRPQVEHCRRALPSGA